MLSLGYNNTYLQVKMWIDNDVIWYNLFYASVFSFTLQHWNRNTQNRK